MILSRILPRTERRDIGQYPLTECGSLPGFGIGMTKAVFSLRDNDEAPSSFGQSFGELAQ